jgi:hypothetical protein
MRVVVLNTADATRKVVPRRDYKRQARANGAIIELENKEECRIPQLLWPCQLFEMARRLGTGNTYDVDDATGGTCPSSTTLLRHQSPLSSQRQQGS